MLINVTREYADILKKYMKKFGLEVTDIVFLVKPANKNNIKALLKYTGGLTLETQEALANIFGLRHFEFANPTHPLPKFANLPEATKKRIAYRKEMGAHEDSTYNQTELTNQIRDAISKYQIGEEFLAEDIAKLIFEGHGDHYSVSQLIDRFNKSFKGTILKTSRKDVSRTGRGPKPTFFRLINDSKP